LISIRKQDQGASKAVYHFVPLQDFSKPWTDEELYAKYGLTED
jgi:site-specific DNA-methyltransferase (adenine-specific)